jgi:hypothetical protein
LIVSLNVAMMLVVFADEAIDWSAGVTPVTCGRVASETSARVRRVLQVEFPPVSLARARA